MTDYSERRRYPRRRYQVDLSFQFGGQIHRAEGLDLSLDGIGFHSGLDIPNKTQVELYLSLPAGERVVSVAVWGTVRWHLEVMPGVYRYGVTFAELDDDQRGAIGGYLSDAKLPDFS
jgi:hypothetical protein